MDLLELIMSHSWLSVVTSGGWIYQNVEYCVSSNPDVVITGIVGFYGLMTKVDLLLLLLTDNLEIVGQLSGIGYLN